MTVDPKADAEHGRSASPPAEVARRGRGRPRDARVDAAVIEATLELIAEGGVANLSMDQVAHRAGVGKPTIYRRWTNKEAMLLDALRTARKPLEAPDTGTLRGDLEAYLTMLADRYRTSTLGDAIPHLIEAAYYDPALRAELEQYSRFRQKPVRAILRRAAKRGELGEFTSRSDMDTMVSALMGPFNYRSMVTHEALDDRFVRRLLDIVLPLGGASNDAG